MKSWVNFLKLTGRFSFVSDKVASIMKEFGVFVDKYFFSVNVDMLLETKAPLMSRLRPA